MLGLLYIAVFRPRLCYNIMCNPYTIYNNKTIKELQMRATQLVVNMMKFRYAEKL